MRAASKLAVADDDADDLLAVAVQLHRADAGNASQLRDRAGTPSRDRLDGRVVKDDERSDRVGFRSGRPPGTKRVREGRAVGWVDLRPTLPLRRAGGLGHGDPTSRRRHEAIEESGPGAAAATP